MVALDEAIGAMISTPSAKKRYEKEIAMIEAERQRHLQKQNNLQWELTKIDNFIAGLDDAIKLLKIRG